MIRFFPVVFLCFAVTVLTAFAESESPGVLVYRVPASSYTEAMEFRSFQQDNALYSTLVTTTGEHKQLQSGGVIAVVLYPPANFDADFANRAEAALAKITSLGHANPTIAASLEQVRAHWQRALSAFQQMESESAEVGARATRPPPMLKVKEGILQKVHISSATSDTVTVMHSTGVTKLPLAELSAPQILLLNRTSEKIQLPLGIARPASASSAAPDSAGESEVTQRIEKAGHTMVEFIARNLGTTSKTVTVWALFVVMPALLLLLFLGLIWSQRQPVTRLQSKTRR